jgi:hypothetical protein
MRRITPNDWAQIRTRVEFGDSMRSVARDFDITDKAIRDKSKKDNWNLEIRLQVAELKENIAQIYAKSTQEHVAYTDLRINQEISEQRQIVKAILGLDQGALTLHSMILNSTIKKVRAGEISEREASQITSSLGLSVDKVASRAGVGGENVQINTQINSGDSKSTVSIQPVKSLKELD